jgi:hypothetical protein
MKGVGLRRYRAGWKLRRRAEPQGMKEPTGGCQERWATTATGAWIVSHKSACDECVDDASAVNATNATDVGAREGLLVGDDCEHLERRPRQRLGRPDLEEGLDELAHVGRRDRLA